MTFCGNKRSLRGFVFRLSHTRWQSKFLLLFYFPSDGNVDYLVCGSAVFLQAKVLPLDTEFHSLTFVLAVKPKTVCVTVNAVSPVVDGEKELLELGFEPQHLLVYFQNIKRKIQNVVSNFTYDCSSSCLDYCIWLVFLFNITGKDNRNKKRYWLTRCLLRSHSTSQH